MLIVTNNPLVKKELSNFKVYYFDCSYREVLLKVQDYIVESKCQLLSHPLSGSIKPNETFYKSILIDEKNNTHVDLNSLEYLESALRVYDKFIASKQRPNWTKEILNDFAIVDYFLIKGALDCANYK